jgi:uncharacterized HhH-GPD family protein
VPGARGQGRALSVGARRRPAEAGARAQLRLAQNDAADALLSTDPFALLLGMLLDQQFPMEKAFAGPRLLASRLGVDRFDPAVLAGLDPARLVAAMAGPPAVHRYHTSMAGRAQALAAHVQTRYGSDTAALWTGVGSASELLARLKALPGFGDQKARIFLALLGKQCGVRPEGWEQAAGDYGRPGFRSVADVVDASSLLKVREFKQTAKAAARDTKGVHG